MKLWRARLRSRVIGACVVLVVGGGALTAVALSTLAPANGPVKLAGDGYGLCLNASGSRDSLAGLEIDNDGDAPATLSSLSALHSSNTELKGVWVLGHPEDGGIGADSYPPTKPVSLVWKTRQLLAGYVLKPRSKVDIVVRLVLAPSERTGVVRGGILRYVADGVPRQSTAGFVLAYAVHGAKCPTY